MTHSSQAMDLKTNLLIFLDITEIGYLSKFTNFFILPAKNRSNTFVTKKLKKFLLL